MTACRENYELLSFQAQLGPEKDALDVPWARYVGDETAPKPFEVATDDPRAPYVEMQVYDVGSFEHDILLNGEPLSGFDVPETEGWQYWMDAVSGPDLKPGANTLQFRRADDGDSFVVGTVVVHWKAPVDE